MSKKSKVKKGSHDEFFKASFSYPEVAESYIRNFLPKKLVENFKLETLHLENTSYITKDLKNFFSDLVWSCDFEGEEKLEISFLFEHKSYPVDYPHIQLLRYLLQKWENQIKKGEALSVLIPIIIYHGEGKWQSRKFYDYFKPKNTNLQKFIPNFEYILTDLNRFTKDDFKKKQMGKLMNTFLALAKIRDIAFLRKHLEQVLIIENFRYEQETDRNFYESLLVYVYNNSELSHSEFSQKVNELPTNLTENSMTLYESILEKGREEGFEIGREEGFEIGREEEKTIFVKNLINQMGLNDEQIMSIASCSMTFVTKVRSEIKA
jgi:predicted transposase/invertase (TIGR01784 family)